MGSAGGGSLWDLRAGESVSGRDGGMAGGRGRRGMFLSHGNWQPRSGLAAPSTPPTHARAHAVTYARTFAVGPAPLTDSLFDSD